MRLIGRFGRDQRGGTAIEYGLIAALIFCTILASVQLFAGQVVRVLSDVSNKVVNASTL